MIDSRNRLSRVPVIVAVAFLLLAMLDRWPYGFYTVLRLVVCGTGAYYTVRFQAASRQGWMWAMVAVALLFNPLVPVGFARSTWVIVDGCAAVFLLLTLCQRELWRAPRVLVGGVSNADGRDLGQSSANR